MPVVALTTSSMSYEVSQLVYGFNMKESLRDDVAPTRENIRTEVFDEITPRAGRAWLHRAYGRNRARQGS